MTSRKINPFGDDDDLDDYGGAWGAPAVSRDAISSIQADAAAFSSSPSDILKDTIRKEAVIKDILASQSDLRTLLARVKTVQGEVDKLQSGNATLKMYVENLTKQASKR
ncbi:hypothetical protein FRC04_005059 [Tulasnella sp. 424]|nr:hypothetical protein FRC04_005059 [Tulasnella sp. 424]KAG8962897.1 hypothetical protein FRC05_005067 [Tulasnella sp. 425]